jgi:hypothetical protein
VVKRISLSAIKAKSPCPEQYKLVAKQWPKGVPLTADTVKKCLELELDLDWIAINFLTAPAFNEYLRVKDRAFAKCYRVRALAKYDRVNDPAWADYKRVTSLALLKFLIKSLHSHAWAGRVH